MDSLKEPAPTLALIPKVGVISSPAPISVFHSCSTGDIFSILSQRQPQAPSQIKKNFPDAICAEMEAASIAQVCHVFQVPFIITRSLSDIYQKGENHVQFDEYLKQASQASAKMCYHLISILSQ